MTRSMWMLPVAFLFVAGTQVYSVEPPSGQEASEDTAPKPDPQIAKWISQLRSDDFKVHEQAAQALLKAIPAVRKATQSKQAEDTAPKPDPQIAKWILQLDNDEFKVREQVAQGLTKAGLKALPAVLKATQSKQPEVRSRAFAILIAMSISDDQATANAVLAATKEILKSPDLHRVAQAKKILKKIHEWKIQGEWITVEVIKRGEKSTVNLGNVVTFSGKKVILGSKDTLEGTFELRPDKKPRELDWIFNSDGRTAVIKAIYELSGDRLKICYLKTKKTKYRHPDALGSTTDDDRYLFLLIRVKGYESNHLPK